MIELWLSIVLNYWLECEVRSHLKYTSNWNPLIKQVVHLEHIDDHAIGIFRDMHHVVALTQDVIKGITLLDFS